MEICKKKKNRAETEEKNSVQITTLEAEVARLKAIIEPREGGA